MVLESNPQKHGTLKVTLKPPARPEEDVAHVQEDPIVVNISGGQLTSEPLSHLRALGKCRLPGFRST